MMKIYCNVCNKYRKSKNPKISNIFKKKKQKKKKKKPKKKQKLKKKKNKKKKKQVFLLLTASVVMNAIKYLKQKN